MILLDNANYYIYIHSSFQEQVKHIYPAKILSQLCLQIAEHLAAPDHQHEQCWLKGDICFHPSFSCYQRFRMTFWTGWRHSKWPTGFGEIWRDLEYLKRIWYLRSQSIQCDVRGNPPLSLRQIINIHTWHPPYSERTRSWRIHASIGHHWFSLFGAKPLSDPKCS